MTECMSLDSLLHIVHSRHTNTSLTARAEGAVTIFSVAVALLLEAWCCTRRNWSAACDAQDAHYDRGCDKVFLSLTQWFLFTFSHRYIASYMEIGRQQCTLGRHCTSKDLRHIFAAHGGSLASDLTKGGLVIIIIIIIITIITTS